MEQPPKEKQEEETEKKQTLLQQSATAFKEVVESGLQSIPQLLEKLNMKQLQEELTRRLDRLRDASARNSEAEVKKTNKEVSEILQRMKDLSDQLEKEIPSYLGVGWWLYREGLGDYNQWEANGDFEEEEEQTIKEDNGSEGSKGPKGPKGSKVR